MRYMTIAGVLGVLATQAQAESKTYRSELIPEKSVQSCSSSDSCNSKMELSYPLAMESCYSERHQGNFYPKQDC